jgi:RNA polymerase sigma-70 factor (ECF subfamily)
MAIHDKKLLLKAKNGDIEAFEMLTKPYQKKIYNVFLSVCDEKDYASILAQEVFVRVYKSLKNSGDNHVLPALIYKTTKDIYVNSVSDQNIVKLR